VRWGTSFVRVKHILPLFCALASAPLAADPRPNWGAPFEPGNARPSAGDGYAQSWSNERPVVGYEGLPAPRGRPEGFGDPSYPNPDVVDPGYPHWDAGPYGGLPPRPPPGYFQQFADGAFRPFEPAGPGFPDYQGYRFRPVGPDGVPEPGVGVGPRFDPGGYAPAPATAFPSYLFRGDTASGMADWQSPSHEAVYRFRPLDAQEQGRLDAGAGYRPVPRRPGDNGWSPSVTPGNAYGFEPGASRAR
jgi:hypothetical protein